MHPATLVIAHRGAHGPGVPENSLAAFERAIELGADMIELDVRRTRDDRLIVVHDHAVDGAPVAELTHDELATRAGARPPLLAEVLELCAGRIGLDVECKEDGYVERIAAELAPVQARGDELVVTSFIDQVLAQMHRMQPPLRTGLLIAWSTDGVLERAVACGAGDIAAPSLLASGRLLRAASAAGLGCLVWSFEPDKDDALLRDGRVRGVITDDVPAAIAARDQR